MQLPSIAQRYIIFCTAGIAGTIVNYTVLYTATEYLNIYYLISATIAFETALIVNFFIDDSWTFSDRKQHAAPQLTRFIRYNIGNTAGLGVNLLVLWTVTEHVGLHYLVSNIFAIIAGSLVNFSLSHHWAWNQQP